MFLLGQVYCHCNKLIQRLHQYVTLLVKIYYQRDNKLLKSSASSNILQIRVMNMSQSVVNVTNCNT